MDNIIDVGLVLYLCKRIGNRHPCTDRALESETFEVTCCLKNKSLWLCSSLAMGRKAGNRGSLESETFEVNGCLKNKSLWLCSSSLARGRKASNRRSRQGRRWVVRVQEDSPSVKGPTPNPGRRSRVMAPMAVPSHRRRTGTVACDGIPTGAAPVAPPPPIIDADLCACIMGPARLSSARWFIPGSIRRDSRGVASTPPSSSRSRRWALTRN